jgi:hypothetical protein
MKDSLVEPLRYRSAKRSHVFAIHNAKTDELGEKVLSVNFDVVKISLSNLTPPIIPY